MRFSVADRVGRHSLSMVPHCVKKPAVAAAVPVR
jgi:hypothetical protein